MDRVSRIEDVRSFETRGGNRRFVVRDSDGNEYTTFREHIGREAESLNGSRARIEYHEEQRGQYTNVYVDRLEAVAEEPPSGEPDTDVQEAAWRTAVEAAPWLVGKPGQEVPPEQLYEKLKPFEARVAEDIEESRREAAED
jgi:hypothetical protein